jgi:hypothetical protein
VKVGDFGLARFVREPLRPLSENGVVVGSACTPSCALSLEYQGQQAGDRRSALDADAGTAAPAGHDLVQGARAAAGRQALHQVSGGGVPLGCSHWAADRVAFAGTASIATRHMATVHSAAGMRQHLCVSASSCAGACHGIFLLDAWLRGD